MADDAPRVRLRREVIAQVDAELAEFARAVSHDFKKPLRQVRAFAELLARRHGDALPDDGRELLGYVVAGAGRMQALLEAYVDGVRVVQGPMKPRAVALDDALDAALESLETRLTAAGAELRRAELPVVQGDLGLLSRLFVELLDNAVAYAGDEPPRVEIGVAGAEVFVRDEGAGFDPTANERVFGWFQRLHPTGNDAAHGVGLALCRRIVAHHGGRIWADSKPGTGTTVRFTLCADSPDSAPARLGPQTEVPPSGSILLVEDDPIVRHAVGVILRREGYDVVAVDNGAQAIERCAEVDPDLVLMDLQMPAVDGLEATRGIRARESEAGRHVPIVALTAHSTQGERDHCQAAGMDGYVSKPFAAADLLRVIQQHLSGDPPHETPPPPPPRPRADDTVFDRSQALANCRGDEALLHEIARMFTSGCPTSLQRVRAAVEAKDGRELAAAAHRLKGMAGNLGGQVLAASAGQLEALGRGGDLAGAAKQLDSLESEAGRLLAELASV